MGEMSWVARIPSRPNNDLCRGFRPCECFHLRNDFMPDLIDKAEEASFSEWQQEAEPLRGKINRFRISLNRFFVDKQDIIDLMVVAAIAQEPLLLIGPPGTAKSDMVLKFKDALGLGSEDYF